MSSQPTQTKQTQRPKLKRRKRRRVCNFCVDKMDVVDYKDINRIKRYVSERGKINPRRNSGVCAKHQRRLSEAIKRARFIGLIPHCSEL
ncbi:MAG: 30S ribosomal protein S18 [bacterium]|nr:30S ribosomal protein S18 [bacterium]